MGIKHCSVTRTLKDGLYSFPWKQGGLMRLLLFVCLPLEMCLVTETSTALLGLGLRSWITMRWEALGTVVFSKIAITNPAYVPASFFLFVFCDQSLCTNVREQCRHYWQNHSSDWGLVSSAPKQIHKALEPSSISRILLPPTSSNQSFLHLFSSQTQLYFYLFPPSLLSGKACFFLTSIILLNIGLQYTVF